MTTVTTSASSPETSPLPAQRALPTHVPDDEAQRNLIHLSWLLKLRWGVIAGQVVTILGVDRVLGIDMPLPPLFVIIALEIASNVGFALWVRRRPRVTQSVLGALMAADVLLFTGLLYFTGGPLNPFNCIYLVHIALAAVVLRMRWTWGLCALSIACFAALFIDAPMAMSDHAHAGHAAHHGTAADTGVQMHLQGMWVAFGVAAAFIVYFVSRVTGDLAQRERELARARTLAARSEKLASLATLAAGAAHELATPLSTIAVVATELERDLERGKSGSETSADARAIREEVERCREVLFRMAADAGQSASDGFSPVGIEQLLASALEGLKQPPRLHVEVDPSAIRSRLFLPRRAIAQALRGVLKNAQQASPAGDGVRVRASADAATLSIEVRDSGSGMTPEVLARAGEPFYTTKEPGQGMGLGLFVARSVFERLGGALELRSAADQGTTATLRLPLGGPRPADPWPGDA
jgi:two-component system, sensor histidine kinase RegB